MAYYSKVLQTGESVKYFGKLHWIIYVKSLILGFGAVICLVMTGLVDSADISYLLVAFLSLSVLAVILFLSSWFVRITTEIVVTDKRIIHKRGWIARRTEEMNVTKVETVDVLQNIPGRILGYGTVVVRGIGSSWEPLIRIAKPLDLRNAIVVG